MDSQSEQPPGVSGCGVDGGVRMYAIRPVLKMLLLAVPAVFGLLFVIKYSAAETAVTV